MKNRVFSKIWIIVILVVLITGGFLAWQYWKIPRVEIKVPEIKISKEIIREKTANWETYRNEKYKYEIKIPSDWRIRESSEKDVVILTDRVPETENKANWFYIWVILSDQLSLREYIDKETKERYEGLNFLQKIYVKPFLKPRQEKTVKINDLEAIQFLWIHLPSPCISTYILKDDLVFELRMIFGKSQEEKSGRRLKYEIPSGDLELFHQMLSTFRFLDEQKVGLSEKVTIDGEASTIKEIVSLFLQDYVSHPLGGIMYYRVEGGLADKISRFPVFTENFKQYVKKSLENESFGFFGDPVIFVSADEGSPTEIKIEGVEIRDATSSAFVDAILKYGVANHWLKIELKKTDGQWKINHTDWLKEKEISPEDIANIGLQWYMAHNDWSGNPYFTETYKKHLDKIDNPIVSPVIFASDTPSQIIINEATVNNSTASLTATLKYINDKNLRVDLLLIDGQWKINNTTLED